MQPAVMWGLLGALSFVPAILFMVWVRNHELRHREPLPATFGVFAYGGTLGIVIALVVGVALDASIARGSILVAAVVVAPVVEEAAKGLGLGLARRHIDELEDGLIYGAAVGLGFAATETMLYAIEELTRASLLDAIAVVAARNTSSLLLHTVSSAALGYGYAVARLRGAPLAAVLPSYLIAVGVHALYNFLVVGLANAWLGFAAAIAMVVVLMGVMLRRIRQLDLLQPSPQ